MTVGGFSYEEARGLSCAGEHVFGGKPLCLGDVAYLVVLRGARVERPPQKQLGDHTA